MKQLLVMAIVSIFVFGENMTQCDQYLSEAKNYNALGAKNLYTPTAGTYFKAAISRYKSAVFVCPEQITRDGQQMQPKGYAHKQLEETKELYNTWKNKVGSVFN